MITYSLTKSENDLSAILRLQERNLPESLSSDEMTTEGFVTLQHDINLLDQICEEYGHVVAKSDGLIIGYALVMLRAYSNSIPILISMFDKIEKIKVNSNPSYIVMGQICIEKTFRGQGVFRGLYERMKTAFAHDFDEIITEVDELNVRSLNAHLHVGFEVLARYESDGKNWMLLGLET